MVREAEKLYWLLGGSLAVLLLASYPLALLPKGLPLDAPWLRWTAATGCGLAAGWLWLRSGAGRRRWLVALAALAGVVAVAAPRGLTGAAHLLPFPTLFWLSLVALLCLTTTQVAMARWLAIALVVALLGIAWQLFRPAANMIETVKLLALVAVPAAIAAWWHWKQPPVARFAWLLAFFWVVLAGKGAWQAWRGEEVVGIVLNRNWLACGLVAAAPWAIYAPWIAWPRHRRLAMVSWATAVIGVSLWLLAACASRGAGLALVVAAATWVWWISWPRLRLALVAIGLIVAAVGWLYGREALVAANARDVRVPIWQATALVIAEHPLIGVGPGNYSARVAFALPRTGYHQRLIATDRVEHPHNELLAIAAQVGIVPALAVLVLLMPLMLKPAETPGWGILIRLSGLVVMVQGMVDKTLVEPPVCLLAFAALGIAWQPYVRAVSVPSLWLRQRRQRWAMNAVLAVVGLWGMWQTVVELRYAWHQRRGEQALAVGAHLGEAGKARMVNEAAMDHFLHCIRLRPARVDGHYAAGVVSLNRLGDLNAALTHFTATWQLDRGYGHLNQLIGKTYLRAGQTERAIYYLELDLYLHPHDTSTLALLYLASADPHLLDMPGGEPPEAKVQARAAAWRQALRLRGPLLHRPGQGTEAVQRWRQAVLGKRPEEAVASAYSLFSYTLMTGVADPLLTELAPDDWQPRLALGDFNWADARYWRLLLWRAELTAGLPTMDQAALAALLARCRERLAAPGAASSRLPDRVWEEGAADWLAVATTFAWLADGLGGDALLYAPAGGEAAVYVLQPDGALYHAAADGAVVRIGAAAVPADFGEQARLVAYPQAFWLRNPTLLTVIAAIDDRWLPGVPEFPYERALRVAGRLKQQVGAVCDPRRLYLSTVLTEEYARLAAMAAREPGGQP